GFQSRSLEKRGQRRLRVFGGPARPRGSARGALPGRGRFGRVGAGLGRIGAGLGRIGAGLGRIGAGLGRIVGGRLDRLVPHVIQLAKRRLGPPVAAAGAPAERVGVLERQRRKRLAL